MRDLEGFIAACQAGLAADAGGPRGVRDAVAEAVGDPAAALRCLGTPTRAGVFPLYRSAELTILNLVWGPMMTLYPHDHRMWAVIGIYGGREDNIFWRRLPEPAGRIEAAGAKALGVRDVATLGRDIVHSVTNPVPRLTGAIHVYGGDFFATERSEWDPEALTEQPYDVAVVQRMFAESNAVRVAG
jgi:predicted metal-dependent enzyme (double-stranded beta helix superfamily)